MTSSQAPRRARPTPKPRTFAALLPFLLMLVGSPVPAGAQEPSTVDEPALSSPLDVLVESRAPLSLSGEQLEELGRIRRGLADINAPLVSRMMALREQWQQERRAGRKGGDRPDPARIARIRTEAARMRTQIQENNRQAMRTVTRVLTPAQRKQLRGIIAARRALDPRRRAGDGVDAGAAR